MDPPRRYPARVNRGKRKVSEEPKDLPRNQTEYVDNAGKRQKLEPKGKPAKGKPTNVGVDNNVVNNNSEVKHDQQAPRQRKQKQLAPIAEEPENAHVALNSTPEASAATNNNGAPAVIAIQSEALVENLAVVNSDTTPEKQGKSAANSQVKAAIEATKVAQEIVEASAKDPNPAAKGLATSLIVILKIKLKANTDTTQAGQVPSVIGANPEPATRGCSKAKADGASQPPPTAAAAVPVVDTARTDNAPPAAKAKPTRATRVAKAKGGEQERDTQKKAEIDRNSRIKEYMMQVQAKNNIPESSALPEQAFRDLIQPVSATNNVAYILPDEESDPLTQLPPGSADAPVQYGPTPAGPRPLRQSADPEFWTAAMREAAENGRKSKALQKRLATRTEEGLANFTVAHSIGNLLDGVIFIPNANLAVMTRDAPLTFEQALDRTKVCLVDEGRLDGDGRGEGIAVDTNGMVVGTYKYVMLPNEGTKVACKECKKLYEQVCQYTCPNYHKQRELYYPETPSRHVALHGGLTAVHDISARTACSLGQIYNREEELRVAREITQQEREYRERLAKKVKVPIVPVVEEDPLINRVEDERMRLNQSQEVCMSTWWRLKRMQEQLNLLPPDEQSHLVLSEDLGGDWEGGQSAHSVQSAIRNAFGRESGKKILAELFARPTKVIPLVMARLWEHWKEIKAEDLGSIRERLELDMDYRARESARMKTYNGQRRQLARDQGSKFTKEHGAKEPKRNGERVLSSEEVAFEKEREDARQETVARATAMGFDLPETPAVDEEAFCPDMITYEMVEQVRKTRQARLDRLESGEMFEKAKEVGKVVTIHGRAITRRTYETRGGYVPADLGAHVAEADLQPMGPLEHWAQSRDKLSLIAEYKARQAEIARMMANVQDSNVRETTRDFAAFRVENTRADVHGSSLSGTASKPVTSLGKTMGTKQTLAEKMEAAKARQAKIALAMANVQESSVRDAPRGASPLPAGLEALVPNAPLAITTNPTPHGKATIDHVELQQEERVARSTESGATRFTENGNAPNIPTESSTPNGQEPAPVDAEVPATITNLSKAPRRGEIPVGPALARQLRPRNGVSVEQTADLMTLQGIVDDPVGVVVPDGGDSSAATDGVEGAKRSEGDGEGEERDESDGEDEKDGSKRSGDDGKKPDEESAHSESENDKDDGPPKGGAPVKKAQAKMSTRKKTAVKTTADEEDDESPLYIIVDPREFDDQGKRLIGEDGKPVPHFTFVINRPDHDRLVVHKSRKTGKELEPSKYLKKVDFKDQIWITEMNKWRRQVLRRGGDIAVYQAPREEYTQEEQNFLREYVKQDIQNRTAEVVRVRPGWKAIMNAFAARFQWTTRTASALTSWCGRDPEILIMKGINKEAGNATEGNKKKRKAQDEQENADENEAEEANDGPPKKKLTLKLRTLRAAVEAAENENNDGSEEESEAEQANKGQVNKGATKSRKDDEDDESFMLPGPSKKRPKRS